MNRDDIIRMARDAGLGEITVGVWSEYLERFAALVAAAEREACIELTDSRCQCAWAIKARGGE